MAEILIQMESIILVFDPRCGSNPCACPKETDCDETASKNTEHVQSLWVAFISKGLKENFIDKYMKDSVENGVTIQYNPATNHI